MGWFSKTDEKEVEEKIQVVATSKSGNTIILQYRSDDDDIDQRLVEKLEEYFTQGYDLKGYSNETDYVECKIILVKN